MTVVDRALVRVVAVMGTVVSFHLERGTCPEPEAHAAVDRAVRRLHEIDAVFSTWKPDSPLSRFRSGRLGWDDLPADVPVVLDLCDQARELSAGWFDPWAMPGGVDPTGLVKGWAVEQALSELEAAGVASAYVNGGGDVAFFGEPAGGGAWRIGIRHPWRPDALACVLLAEAPTAAVATSGRYERGDHLVNPKLPAGPPAAASATVLGRSLAMADALATALAVGGGPVFDLISSHDDYEAYLIGADGSEQASSGVAFA